MNLSNLVVMYFIVGAVMFGGGAVSWDDSGVTQFFVANDGGDLSPNSELASTLNATDSSISSVIGVFSGGLLLVWNLVFGVVAFLHWPLVVLIEANAPVSVTLLLGGTFVAMFYVSLVRLLKR